MTTTQALKFHPDAGKTYLHLEKHLTHFSNLDRTYVADEIRRVVAAIAQDPYQPWLQRLRGFTEIPGAFCVIIPTATGVEYEAAVWWEISPDGGSPYILAIVTKYVR